MRSAGLTVTIEDVAIASPFTVEEARSKGLTRRQLVNGKWRRLGPAVYAARDLADDPLVRLRAALLRLPKGACFSGRTAAWLHRLDDRQPSAIEATIPPPTSISERTGMTIRRSHLTRDEVAIRRGFPVTSALRTVLDLACRLDPVEAVAVIDTALHKRLVSIESLRVWAAAHPRYRGVARLRRAVDLAEAATESPMETRLRLLLVLAGLPRPQVQVSLHDVFARADLYYPDNRLVIEYDGATHRESLAADNRRQNRLVDAGYRVLRFTASDVLADPASIVGIVRRALSPSFRRRSATLEP